MKKIFNKCLLALAVVPFFTMCSKTNEMVQHGQVTITANIEDTKVSLTQGEEKLVLSWEEGDALNVIGTTTEKFTIKSGFTAKSANFTGNEVAGSTFDIVYPAKYVSVDAITARSYTGQVQDGNGSTAHLEYNAVVANADDYKVISFAKGAAGVKMNGALKLVVKLPDDVTAVSSLKLTAPDAIFFTTNGTSDKSESLSMSFTNTTIGDDHTLTAYMMTSWQDVTIAADTKLTLEVTAPEQSSFYSKTFHCTTEQTISGGATFVIDISSATLAYTLKGSGTETDPYLLYTAQDLLCIRPVIEANVNVYQYFKLMADIDMSSIDNWTPINDGNVKDGDGKEFAGRIHFDGNNKTLSNLKSTNKAYTSFFGVFIGSVKNLTFENPVISANSSSCAVIGGYIGQTTNLGKVENVTINGADVSYNSSDKSAVAAIAGATIATAEISGVTVANSTFTYNAANSNNESGILFGKQNNAQYTINISDCHAINSTVTYTKAPKCCGGVIGYFVAGTISKCSVIGDINAGCNNTGGIVGNFGAGKISECWYSGNLTVKDNSGGIAGAQSSTGSTSDVIIENCYSCGTITNASSQKSGGIAGECCKNSKIRNCYSTMSISGGGRVFGSIAGRFNNNQWNGNKDEDFNMEVTNCIAAGSINSTATSTTLGSSGAVLGSCPVKVAHYTNCWRIYNFTYNVEYATTGVGLVDQGYTVTSFTDGTYQQSGYTTNSNWYPYHASEATATALQTAYSGWTTSKTDAQITVSDIAAATNHSDSNAWKSDIWDLSGDYPTLKNNPEPEL